MKDTIIGYLGRSREQLLELLDYLEDRIDHDDEFYSRVLVIVAELDGLIGEVTK